MFVADAANERIDLEAARAKVPETRKVSMEKEAKRPRPRPHAIKEPTVEQCLEKVVSERYYNNCELQNWLSRALLLGYRLVCFFTSHSRRLLRQNGFR